MADRAGEAIDVHVGVDVGGTNTDAVVVNDGNVIGLHKQTTTDDVTVGVRQAIWTALQNAAKQTKQSLNVQRVHIGTTHFVNAVVERRELAQVAVLRLCGPASTELPPFVDFPTQLLKVVGGPVYMLDGGHHFDGRVIKEVNPQQVINTIQQLKEKQIKNVVISGVFSPSVNDHEIQVGSLFSEHYPEASVTLSHQIAQLNILLRENAAILNECLRPLSKRTIEAFQTALTQLGLTCPFFLTQNDGTLISAEDSLKTPVYTFASGTTNSMRGAAFLSGVQNGVVVDIGGTSTDCGMLIDGFPRPAEAKVKVGGVLTNFRMPDVMSVGLGGGSIVTVEGDKVEVGPQSVGSLLEKKSLVFGGDTLTASDIAVVKGLVTMGTQQTPKLDDGLVSKAIDKMRQTVEDMVDKMKTSESDIPVVLVGGGSVLIDRSKVLKGSNKTLVPAHYEVANAVGAALSQVAGNVDTLVNLLHTSRQQAIDTAIQQAKDAAVAVGANRDTLKVVNVQEVPLSYVPGNVTRVCVKVVGDLAWERTDGCLWQEQLMPLHITSNNAAEKSRGVGGHDEEEVTETEPHIDSETGEWSLSEWDLACIAVGAGILGCGGGGDPHNGFLLARRLLRKGKKIRIITPDRLSSSSRSRSKMSGCIVPVAMMGAPTILVELLVNRALTTAAIDAILETPAYHSPADNHDTCGELKGILYMDHIAAHENSVRKKLEEEIAAILCLEIGGANSITALVEGGEHDIPIVDADCMGRAFPEIQHCTPLIYGHPPYPAGLGSIDGRGAAVLYVDGPKHLEDHFRNVCVQMGCIAGFVLGPIHVSDMEEYIIPYSYSRAWKLGRAVMHARKHKVDPIQCILEQEGGRIIFTGKIVDVERRTVGGFARGVVKIEGFNDFQDKLLQINFQNENLIAEMMTDNESKLMACTPDLISIIIVDTGSPLATEELRYGLRVAVLCIAAPALLRTERALKYVGPRAFGYPEDKVIYQAFGESRTFQPVGPK